MPLLDEAVDEIIALAKQDLTVSTDKEAIRWGTRRISEALDIWRRQDEVVQRTLRTFLDIMEKNCKHEGATHGYDEREGSWMSTCPTCGASK